MRGPDAGTDGRGPWLPGEGIVGEGPAMQALAARVERVAGSALPVLIQGESGAGKELVARAIHGRSGRAGRPFVTENCSALAEGLLDGELFGWERGAFTGAERDHDGLLVRAHGGTLLVDEVGDMPPAMQAKLLRVLQEGEVRRVGGERPRAIDVRVLAATHKDLATLAQAGRFRHDLYYRLAVLEVRVPPLRERLEDIPLLARHVLARLGAELDREPPLLTASVLDALMSHDWPGNVRELENALRVAALFARGRKLSADALPFVARRRGRPGGSEVSLPGAGGYRNLLQLLRTRERDYVRQVLREEANNKARAARRLGITRYALYRVLRRLGLEARVEGAAAEAAA